MEKMYTDLSFTISSLVTRRYSTSFSRAVSYLDKEKREAIYSIYGFVRFADEIVDSFHDYDKATLLKKFETDYYDALKYGISMNPVLHSFQYVVRKYGISDDLVQTFLNSMKADLSQKDYSTESEIGEYIYGSAEVVGLMCLKVFINGDEQVYNNLRQPAQSLGAAFQKVNFLRDINQDLVQLGRRYFPEIVNTGITDEVKQKIIADIENDFNKALPGIRNLPGRSRLGVLIAFKYYRTLLSRIKGTPVKMLMKKRIRVPDYQKYLLFLRAYIANSLNII